MKQLRGDPNKARNLPQDLPFGFDPRVPPPPLYQDVWNLNCVSRPFDSKQTGAPAPIREHGQALAQQSAQKASAPNFLLPGINTLPGIKIFSRKNRPFPEPVHFYEPPKYQYANFNKYLHDSLDVYRHTLPPAPKIPKFGAPLLPREPYIEPQYSIQEELHTQSIVDILFPESRSFWNRDSQKPEPKVPEFEASLVSSRRLHGKPQVSFPNESQDVADILFVPDFESLPNRDAQKPKPEVPEFEAPLSPKGPHEEPQVSTSNVDESPTQNIAHGSPNGNSQEPELPTSCDSKNEQYRCSNCKKFTKKIVGKKTKKPEENWICRICYFKEYNKSRRRYRASSK